MRTITQEFTAGETKSFTLQGRYFEVFRATNQCLEVVFRGQNGGDMNDNKLDAIGAGVWVNLRDDFYGFSIKSTIAQTVTFLIGTGEGGTRQTAAFISNAVMPPTRPEISTKAGFSLSEFWALTPEEIIPVASNVGGIILQKIKMQYLAQTVGQGIFFYSNVAPANPLSNLTNIPSGAVVIATTHVHVVCNSIYVQLVAETNKNIFIPSGHGLWWCSSQHSNTAGNGNASRFLNWKEL